MEEMGERLLGKIRYPNHRRCSEFISLISFCQKLGFAFEK